jgi:hypothetical protein
LLDQIAACLRNLIKRLGDGYVPLIASEIAADHGATIDV